MANDIKNTLNNLASKVSEATGAKTSLQTVDDCANIFPQNLIVNDSWQLLTPAEQEQLQENGITSNLIIKLINKINKLE